MGDYPAHITAEHERISNHFGTEEVLLYQAALLSIGSLASELGVQQPNCGKTPPPWWLRRRFEAMTGIDCGSFYEDEEFQPLTGAALLEDFRDSGGLAQFDEGVRYFFGHRVP